ncbi:unnamed protein product [Gongylonema pulchrum]|uniref:7TM_GPCR_Srx domain-containing protein n=1 Tax=Gongylonema pulchrum TaxID=637853 RepID=A0A183CVN8_9BILA|nr:unnamed protein product [Gongylonema pulchrum]
MSTIPKCVWHSLQLFSVLQFAKYYCNCCLDYCGTEKNRKFHSPTMFLARLAGVLSNAAWFSAILTHFFVSLNRFCAFMFPIRYNRLWSETKALLAGCFSWSVGITFSLPALFGKSLSFFCSLIFHESSDYRWSYRPTLCGSILGNADVVGTIAITLSMACLDLITYIKYLAHQKAISTNMLVQTSGGMKEHDVMFLKQSCVCGLFYVTCIVVFNFNSHFSTNKWFLFGTSTIYWIFTHSMDGYS